ncbi:helix-turn-helix transcriptional regulator [Phenylobacterium sp.]|uniref:LexA family transcriptional regulator n=1 Tax=Phenylobacterium sp. TaxID=1871053 RepID=UPI00272EE963|nr:S24 family peptidase [Phenylobacterium sp.]MDP1617304.1 S24 family peptidase [Phenylobacterium sp.]MDP1985676.1 S24 family peptidase [Phenylobacterium sp.]
MDQIVADFDYDGFAQRAKEAIFPEKITAFATRIGMQHGTVSKVLNVRGSMAPRLDIAAKIAEGAGVTLDWLVFGRGDGPGHADLVQVPRYDAQLAAGAGAWNEGRLKLEDVPFTKAFLKEQLGRDTAAGLVIVTARGDSMEPTISDRAWLLVDEAEQRVFDGVFAFVLADEARVKRLRRLTDGLLLISDNDSYPPEEVRGEELKKLQIIGPVLTTIQPI